MANKQPVARKTPAAPVKPTKTVPAKQSTATAASKRPTSAETNKDRGHKSSGKKQKTIRDSFNMPAADYALIGELKSRVLATGQEMKKSELLRAGIKALSGMNDAEFKRAIGAVARVKRGRPTKKQK